MHFEFFHDLFQGTISDFPPVLVGKLQGFIRPTLINAINRHLDEGCGGVGCRGVSWVFDSVDQPNKKPIKVKIISLQDVSKCQTSHKNK